MPAFEIDIRKEKKHDRISLVRLKKVAEGILRQQGFRSGALSVLLVSDYKMRKINKEFLRHDYATDVISFGQIEGKAKRVGFPKGSKPLLGDVVISLDTAKRQAKEYGHSFFYEVCFYLCHGILHILGWDDHTKKQREKMWKKQEQILEKVL